MLSAAPRRFTVAVEVVLRPCRQADLPALEWFGLFAADRGLIARVFAQHRQGQALMLVAEAQGEPSGQLWVDLSRRAEGVGEIWAVRVLPGLQGCGIGTRLMAMAEAALREAGFTEAVVTVETGNPRARQLYERLGYRLRGTRLAGFLHGLPADQERSQWLLSKPLQPAPPAPGSACAGPSGT